MRSKYTASFPHSQEKTKESFRLLCPPMPNFAAMARIFGIEIGKSKQPELLRGGVTADDVVRWWSDGSIGTVLASLGLPNIPGAQVSVDADSVVGLPAVMRALDVVSGSIALMPLNVVEKHVDGRVEPRIEHDLQYILHDEPNKAMTAFTFFQTLVSQMKLYGNAYAIIYHDDDRDRPTALHVIDQARFRVEVYVENARSHEMQDVFYIVHNGTEQKSYTSDKIIHLKNLGSSGLAGLNTLGINQENFRVALQARRFGDSFYAQGTNLSGYIKVPQALTPDGYKRMSSSWKQAHSGAGKAHGVAILEQGSDFHPVRMKPDEALMLEAQQFSVIEVARILGVPPHLLFALDKATYNNIEQLGLEFATYTLLPLATQIEQELSRKLFRPSERRPTRTRKSVIRAQFDMSELNRADADTRARFYASGISHGWLKPDEIRKREGYSPVPGGDKPYIQMQYIPLEAASEGKAITGGDTQPASDEEE
jgi:HK97 family phage portal protein